MLKINFTLTHAQLHIKEKQWGMNLLSRGAATMRRRVSMQEAEGDEMIQINIVYMENIYCVDIFVSYLAINYLTYNI